MAVDDLGVIDIMSFDTATGDVVLTISDHLDWSEPTEHLELLQRKVNAYLAFVEDGELVHRYPEARERSVVFRVVFKFKPSREASDFLNSARLKLELVGIQLRQDLFALSYDN